MRTIICIPTYNEMENIQAIISKIFEVVPEISIVVIDDGSPDGTGKIAEDQKKKYSNLYLIERSGKMGLASAYIAGFKFALENNFDAAMTMDADFSHNPNYLPEFLKLAEKFDFVIGSRYVDGGGTVNWGIERKILSKGGNLYARNILSMPYHDLTGGFNLLSREVLKGLSLDTFKTEGYSFHINMKFRAHKKGFKGIETPIIFEDRRVGKSKMSTGIIVEAMLKVPFLRFEKF